MMEATHGKEFEEIIEDEIEVLDIGIEEYFYSKVELRLRKLKKIETSRRTL